jgi:hypothetical protein
MGCALCRTGGGWLVPTTGFDVYVMLPEGGFAYWKLPLPAVVVAAGFLVGAGCEAGAAVYAKLCAVGAYWTVPGWA